MTDLQLEMAIQDVREQLNEIYNEHAELKEKVRELRVNAGLEPVSSPEINTPTDNTCVVI